MSEVMKSIDSRTNLAGQNRLEMLLFKLNGTPTYGINVFKVREVIHCPELSEMPGTAPQVKGIVHLRGETVTVIDLSAAIGGVPLPADADGFVIVTEYNRHIQGFLVRSVDRIINLHWDDIIPPPAGAGKRHYLTAVAKTNDGLIQVIDVEKVFSELSEQETTISDGLKEKLTGRDLSEITVLAADDSRVARTQIKKVLEDMGLKVVLVEDGKAALDWLTAEAGKSDQPLEQRIPLLISDIEMPRMDGYTLTAEVKAHPQLKNIHVVLHSSLSGVFNERMIKRVGADTFIAKFHPDELGELVQSLLFQQA
ncbi:chemotaxis protein [Chromatiaceae bacterium AAb-1]|nr:chemotaxis protein [Chromatiaceae bacterium AAb-1]